LSLHLMATLQSQQSGRRVSGARLASLLGRYTEERDLRGYVVLAILLAVVSIGLYFEFRLLSVTARASPGHWL